VEVSTSPMSLLLDRLSASILQLWFWKNNQRERK
jgi:hypothetical protein